VDPDSGITIAPFVDDFIVPLIRDYPFGFFFFNIIWFALLTFILMKFMKRLLQKTLNSKSLVHSYNMKIHCANFERYYKAKHVMGIDNIIDEAGSLFVKADWIDKDTVCWGGDTPSITAFYSATNQSLISVTFRWQANKTQMDNNDFITKFLEEMMKYEAIDAQFNMKARSSRRTSLFASAESEDALQTIMNSSLSSQTLDMHLLIKQSVHKLSVHKLNN
jgi:hypothetical protein